MTTTAIASTDEPIGVRGLLRAAAERWAPFIPKGVDPEAVVQSVYLESKRLPTLLECSGESIVQAVTRGLQLGLEFGITAYLVPFKDTKSNGKVCTLVVAKDGVVQLIIGTGVVRHVQARCVYKNEAYRFLTGTQTIVEHRPIFDPDARGPMIGAYAVFRMRGGDVQAFEMSLKEIDAIRRKYSKQWKDGACPDWYAEKTVIIHGAKHLPKNPKLARLEAVLTEDDMAEADLAPTARASVVHEPPAEQPAPAPPAALGAGPAQPIAVPTRTREPARQAPPVSDQAVEPYSDVRRDETAPVSPMAVEEAKRALAKHGADAGYGMPARPIEDVVSRLDELPFQDDRDLTD